MPGAADFVQKTVHALEEGLGAIWVKRILSVAAIVGLALFYFMHEFRGLATSQAMDQAQIGRNIASGQGWKTNFVRPRAVGQLKEHHKNVQAKIWYDTYNAPLPSLVNAFALRPIKSKWVMQPKDVVYPGDRVIVFAAICFFLASLLILYFTARLLFDDRLAILATGMVLLCDTIWQYSLSGLPQMLLMFLFNATVYALVRAVQSQYAGGRVGVWLALSGLGFGLLALSHALTIWIFAAALIYSVFFFRPRGWAAVIMLSVFVLVYSPWLVRNYTVCGNPGGSAVYSILDGINHTEAGHMRRLELDLEGAGPGQLRNKFVANLTGQLGGMMGYLGYSVVALTFFVSLLHLYKRKETAAIRWLVLVMWVGAAMGMAIYGINQEQGLAANQLHLVFIPIMTCFGLAYLLVQWNRLEIDYRLARIGFITLLFVLSSLPMILNVAAPARKAAIRWPPYVPPYISVLHQWMGPAEMTASDMPWAVAWYADRPSLWLPETVKAFTEFHDYGVFGAPLNGLYLTPISGSQNTLGDILKGEYRDWAALILRSVDLQKFPLKWARLLGLENECVFFSDRDRERGGPPPQ